MSETEAPEQDDDKSGLFKQLQDWFKADTEHSRDWRDEAEEDFAFVAGDQWSDEDEQALREQNRPAITFNRVLPVINSVSGSEINNRHEVRYIPRTMGDVQVNEVYTAAAKFFRDESHAEDEESDAFRDAIICGMGWTDTRLDYDEEPDGKSVTERVDPFEMFWDLAASKANLTDARRLWRVRDLSRGEALAMFPDADPDSLDASWARNDDVSEPTHAEAPFYDVSEMQSDKASDDAGVRVTVVQCQWYEREAFWRVQMPADPMLGAAGQIEELSEEQYKAAKKRLGELGIKAVKQYRRVYRQAFLGSEVLEESQPRGGKGFTWHCITGYRDRNSGTWYGIVKPMKDPQRWANKWLSQALHILNANAKGGIMAEADAFADPQQAKETWARPDGITFVNKNALQAGKIQPKPTAPLPAGFMQLMEFAISSVRDASGVNLELLGQRDEVQAGVLEWQRKKSAMTVLATLFDSLRRYRKLQGQALLDYIDGFLADGRLIRIVGDEGEQYIPLLKQPGVARYDVIVDESASSPNQKEMTWQIIQGMLPTVGAMMSPDMWALILEYSPLPASMTQKFKEQIQQAQANPPPNPEIMKAQAQMQIEQTKAQTAAQLETEKAQRQAELQAAQMQRQAEVERSQALADIAVEERKAQFAMQLKQAEFEYQKQLKIIEAELKAREHQHTMQMKEWDAAQRASVTAEGASAPKPEAPAAVDHTPILAGAMQALAASLSAAHAPKRTSIVRDKSGKAIGAETVIG